MDCFTGGLKPEVGRDVMAQKPLNLLRVTELAKLFDVRLGSIGSGLGSVGGSGSRPTTWSYSKQSPSFSKGPNS